MHPPVAFISDVMESVRGNEFISMQQVVSDNLLFVVLVNVTKIVMNYLIICEVDICYHTALLERTVSYVSINYVRKFVVC